MASEPTLSSLALLASTSESDPNPDSLSPSAPKTKEQIRKHYLRTLHKVIDQADIVILVLDARDPEGCRSRLVEEEVRRRESEGKKLVFVLNKIGARPLSCFVSLSHSACTSGDFPVPRPRSAPKRTGVAAPPAPFDPYSPLPLSLRAPAPAHEPRLLNRPRAPPPP